MSDQKEIPDDGHARNAGGAGITRRGLLKGGAALGLATGLGGPFIRTASAAEPIKIGVLLPKTGTYAAQGRQGHNGATIAVDDFGGKVLGRPVKLVWLDENGPQMTQQHMHKLIKEEKVVAVQGGISSGDVLAVMSIAEKNKTLMMATGPNATQITGSKCNRYTFRVDLPNHATVRTVFPHLKSHGLNWYFLVASYAWGIDAYNQMKSLLVQNGGKAIGSDQAPLGTSDFSSYILKMKAANPDVIFLGLGGRDLTNFLKQAHQVGITGKVPISAPISNDTDFWAAGPNAVAGIYPKIWNYTGSQDTEKSHEFVKKYEAKFPTPPESEAWQDWFGTTAILTAIKETQSTKGEDLVKFLEGHKFNGYKKREMYFRDFDHQLIQPTLVAKVKSKITSKYDYFDIVDVEPAADKPVDSIYVSKSQSNCKMGSL